ncbi:hypothetical protein [Sphingomonas sp. M1-B02]|uniref:hypothetical protein n=1 Tax=Sphingomonas sp. M1-B02 TaxID=3114300 RepID=UPI00223F9CAA|nr:hypothetical protein [Sphingomonas sp. S6-11]UZK66991.1 hypothetical protein OKW87_03945 [Sphingomonas sp. S6-11]
MIGRPESRNARRYVALLLVACALLFRMALPAGWMPQASASGLTLSWCADSGTGGNAALAEAKALLADATGEQSEPEHQPATDQPCAFAAAAQPLATFAPVPMLVPADASAPALTPTPAAAPGRGLAAPPPRSTGPPALI